MERDDDLGVSLEKIHEQLKKRFAMPLTAEKVYKIMTDKDGNERVGRKIKVCIRCHNELLLGRFAHNQDVCWDCFKKEVRLMLERIDEYPSWLWDKRDEHKDILNWMVAVIAESYGEEW